MRRASCLLWLLLGCGDSPGASDAATEATGSSSDTPAGSTSGGDPSSSDTGSGMDGPEPTTTGGDSTTGAGICSTPYVWEASATKDVLVVVAIDPAALGAFDIDALHAAAVRVASDSGLHVAVAAPPTGNEPPAADGYEALALPAATDPIELAALVQPGASFRRAHVPLRGIVVSEMDTAWDAGMLRAAMEPLRFAQIDARIRVADIAECDAITGLAALATVTSGSLSCTTTLDAGDLLDADGVLAAQPSCLLPTDAPPPVEPAEWSLALYGISPAGPRSDFPDGPVACRESASGWTIADPRTGAIGLCPSRCRAVASWYIGDRLSADVAWECVR